MIGDVLHRLFVSTAVITSVCGIIYIPVKLMDVRTKGKELEAYAIQKGITLQEAAVHFGYQKPAPKAEE
jgi:hypothetical protein